MTDSPGPRSSDPRPAPSQHGALRRAWKGRGAGSDPPNRFERLHYLPEAPEDVGLEHEEEPPAPRTVYLRDPSRTILAHNQSPDIGFDTSVNPYRGCEHGCSYCYARPTHEYLGLSAGLDFETRILVKTDAPVLLRRALMARSWQPQVIAFSGVTDAYQPVERRLRITRGCLEVLRAFRNPVAIVTKNRLVARDADLLAELARFDCASVSISVTSLDPALQRAMEPRASSPAQRLRAVAALAEAGVPVGVMVAPIVPGINDHEVPRILRAAADAGAQFANPIVLRLPHGVKELFDAWLERHFPERRRKVLSRVRAMRDGRLNDARFRSRMRGEGVFAEQIQALFATSRRRAGIPDEPPALSTAHFRRPGEGIQERLF
ncbi:MAG: PA0069 family radical SAM protein [Myxococcota bacterium]|nr:PA0069 family radical SAM protein [Myxococcota bacterium]